VNKSVLIVIAGALTACGCVSLTYHEKQNLALLRHNGVTVDRPVGAFESPNSPLVAGLLNLLPGFGNFYLALGKGSDSVQGVYGLANLWFWPFSIVWAAPQGVIDAERLNEREMLQYYRYDARGRKALEERGLTLD
jgi:hypothetical protein